MGSAARASRSRFCWRRRRQPPDHPPEPHPPPRRIITSLAPSTTLQATKGGQPCREGGTTRRSSRPARRDAGGHGHGPLQLLRVLFQHPLWRWHRYGSDGGRGSGGPRNFMVHKPLGSLSIVHFNGHGFLDQRVELIHWLRSTAVIGRAPSQDSRQWVSLPEGRPSLCEVSATAEVAPPPGRSDTYRRTTDGHGHDGLRHPLPARQLKEAFLLGKR